MSAPNTAASADGREALTVPTGAEIEAAIKATEYKYFGDYELSADQFDAVDVLIRAAKSLSAPPVEAGGVSVPFEFPYQRTFNAIGDAVKVQWCNATPPKHGLSISVEAFQKSFNESPLSDALTAHPAPDPPELVSDAVRDIAAERQRQIEVEGWSPEHDDEHDSGEIARAAACYATGRTFEDQYPRWRRSDGPKPRVPWRLWPWDLAWWKPKDRRSDLVRAGALIVAEIERLDRAALTAAKGKGK